MFNTEEFIKEFVEAAKNNDENLMKELADKISAESLEFRTELVSDLVDAMKESKANPKVEAGLASTLKLMKLAVEAQDSAGEEGKDKSEPEEATQDVAADTSAVESAGDSTEAAAGAAETGDVTDGKAPAEEEKEEKTEQ